MMHRMKKGARLCSILLALVLVLSLMPTQAAFASDTDNETALEVTQPVEDHEDEPAPANETGGTDESAPKQEKKNDEPATPVKSGDEEEKPALAAASDDESTQDNDNAEAPAPVSSSSDEEEPAPSASAKELADTGSDDAAPAPAAVSDDAVEQDADQHADTGGEEVEEQSSDEITDSGEDDKDGTVSTSPSKDDAAQEEEGTDSNQPAEQEDDTDSEKDDVRASENEETEKSAKSVELDAEEVALEEPIEEMPALSAMTARGARALLQAGTGDHPCSYCGQPGLFMALDERVHGYVCQSVGCPHYRDKAYMYDTEAHQKGKISSTSPTFHSYKCTICDTVYTDEPHSFGEWQNNGDGTHTGVCKCGRTQTVAHTYTWTYVDDDTHKGVCECGVETTEAHYDRWASACGRQPHCEKCDHDYGTIPEHEMWYEDRGESGHKPSCYHCDMYFFLEAHSYSDWKDNGDGTHTGKCVCGRTQSVAHTYTWTYVDDDTHKGVCECGTETTEAHYDRWASACGRQPHCEKCDYDYGSIPEHEMWYEDRGENGHKPSCYHCDTYFFLEAHSFAAATCVSGPTCEKCGAVYGDPDPDNHDWSEWMPDPDDANHHCRVCKRKGCDKKQVDLHHDDKVYRDETCHAFVCNVCGGTLFYVESHQFNSWHPNGNDTHSRECDGCRWKETESHSGGTATCTSGPICEMCGVEYDKPLGHDLKATARVEPTCTESGTEAYWTCQRDGCGKRFSDAEGKTEIEAPVVIPALGHDLIHHDAQAPTCTAIGWDAYDTCSRCDYTTYVEQKALGHDLLHHEAQAPTCTEIGWGAYDTCSRCDYSTYKEIPALGHDLVHHGVQAATCTEVGWEAYDTCSRCDYSTYKEIAALGHDLKEVARVEPTCTEAGTEAYWMCQRDGCGKMFSDVEGKNEIEAPVVIPAKGHTEVVDPAVPATCTETGLTEGKHCAICNTVLVAQDVVPAKGHTPSATVRENEKPASCTRSGSYDEVVYCSVCGKELSRERKSLSSRGHNYAETGRTITRIYHRCGNCGDSYWINNTRSRSLIPDLVRDENGENVDYIAGVSRESGKRILTVTPDLQGEAARTKVTSLWLKPEYVERWLKEGIGIVRFQRNDAILETELAEITPDWFTLDEKIKIVDFYVFTLDPADDEVLVDVNATIGEMKIPAGTLTGITLKVDEIIVVVRDNSIYRISE